MSAPLAVDPSLLRPGFYLTVNFLRGTSSPGAQGLRAAIVAQVASTSGNIVTNTEIRSVFSKEDVETACGRGPAYFAYQALVANYPAALVDLICCPDSGGAAAAGTLTFSGTPTSNMTFRVWIQGTQIDLPFNVGDALTTARDAAVAKINSYSTSLFVIATAGTGGVVNLTARSKGPVGNDVRLRVAAIAGAGGACAASGATLTGGTTEIDFTTAYANLAIKEYDYILPCVSNTDGQSSSASSNIGRLAAYIDANVTGSTAKLQQGIWGTTGTISQAKTSAIGRNHTNLEQICSVNDESLPCEVAGAELGDRMRRRALESNANRTLQPLKYIHGSADPNGDQPTDAEAQDALSNGVSLVGYTANLQPMILRPVTTHSQDTNGNPDRRCLDTNETDTLYDVAKDLRSFIPQTYQSPDGQVKIAKNRQPGDDPNPQGVVEERDIVATVIARLLSFWVPKGAIDGAKLNAVIADGTLTGNINASDPTQFDLFLPLVPYKILAKIGVYLAKVG